MPDDKDPKDQSEGQKDDGLKNLKSEMDRKLTNYGDQLSKIAEQNQQVMAQLAELAKPKKTEPKKPVDEDDLENLMYDNPKLYAEKIEERAMAKVMDRLEQRDAHVAEFNKKQQAVLTEVVQDFPELSDGQNKLTKRAVEIYQKMNEQDRAIPISYKVAVYEAAAELGISPIKQREIDEDDDFTIGPSSGGKSKRKAPIDKKEAAMFDFAAQLGIDTSNKEVRERLQKSHKRNWTKYE